MCLGCAAPSPTVTGDIDALFTDPQLQERIDGRIGQ
jgi:hypothetical protein